MVRQELPPPAARQVYELTDDGRDLATAITPLIAWGARRLSEQDPADAFQPRWAAIGKSVLADREAAKGVRETYQFLIGGSAFPPAVEDGDISVRDGLAEEAAVTWTTDGRTWSAIASGRISAPSAVADGSLTVHGEAQPARRLRKILSRKQRLVRAPEVANQRARTRRAPTSDSTG